MEIPQKHIAVLYQSLDLHLVLIIFESTNHRLQSRHLSANRKYPWGPRYFPEAVLQMLVQL